MKIELDIDVGKLATNTAIELIVTEVLDRLDARWADVVSQQMEDIEDLVEDLESRMEFGALLADDDVTVIESDGRGSTPRVKTCSKFEAVLDTKMEELHDRVVDSVLQRITMVDGADMH